MRFSTLVAFVFPLSALAAPFLVRRNDSFDQLKNGITAAQGAFEKLYLEAIKPPRQDALAAATTSGRTTLAYLLSTAGLVDLLGDALQSGTLPSTDITDQIAEDIATVRSAITDKVEKAVDCTGANGENAVCGDIREAIDGLSAASKALDILQPGVVPNGFWASG